MMILEFLKNLIIFPCTWFWEKVQKYKEENAILKMIALFAFSLTGLFVLAMAFVLLIELLINIASEHSGIVFVALVVIWLYLYAKSRMNKSEEQKQQLHMEKDLAVQNENAIRGYAAIANAMYQVLRGMASEIDSKTPCMMAEIELPEEKYVLRNNVCFYQFMALKKDTAVYESVLSIHVLGSLCQGCTSHSIAALYQLAKLREESRGLSTWGLYFVALVTNYTVKSEFLMEPYPADRLHPHRLIVAYEYGCTLIRGGLLESLEQGGLLLAIKLSQQHDVLFGYIRVHLNFINPNILTGHFWSYYQHSFPASVNNQVNHDLGLT